ncbi:MAG: DUF4827 domain-containing protein [Dysgonamonadaceae bacterium]|jgi:hypothetical protein|nr:DUF4827 domain-containing protein [Dysgonamonadaceae bacterium]
MKKISYIIFALIGLLMITASCNRQKTYAEYLRDESRAIDRFISQNNFVILREFPRDTVFGENEFFRDPATGVFYNIVSRGDIDNKIEIGRALFVRFRGLHYFMTNDTTLYSNDNSPMPIEMVFRGPVTMQNRALYESAIPAFVVPLQHVGHRGRVRMIVPFNMGSAYDRQVFQASFYDEIDYRFERWSSN